jgi:hypothetical protein
MSRADCPRGKTNRERNEEAPGRAAGGGKRRATRGGAQVSVVLPGQSVEAFDRFGLVSNLLGTVGRPTNRAKERRIERSCRPTKPNGISSRFSRPSPFISVCFDCNADRAVRQIVGVSKIACVAGLYRTRKQSRRRKQRKRDNDFSVSSVYSCSSSFRIQASADCRKSKSGSCF